MKDLVDRDSAKRTHLEDSADGNPLRGIYHYQAIKTMFRIAIPDLYNRKTKILNRYKSTAFIDEMRRAVILRRTKPPTQTDLPLHHPQPNPVPHIRNQKMPQKERKGVKFLNQAEQNAPEMYNVCTQQKSPPFGELKC